MSPQRFELLSQHSLSRFHSIVIVFQGFRKVLFRIAEQQLGFYVVGVYFQGLVREFSGGRQGGGIQGLVHNRGSPLHVAERAGGLGQDFIDPLARELIEVGLQFLYRGEVLLVDMIVQFLQVSLDVLRLFRFFLGHGCVIFTLCAEVKIKVFRVSLVTNRVIYYPPAKITL